LDIYPIITKNNTGLHACLRRAERKHYGYEYQLLFEGGDNSCLLKLC